MIALKVVTSVKESGENRHGRKWNVQGDLNGELTLTDLLEFTKRTLIFIADTALKEEQAKGFDPKPKIIVDGKPNKPVDQVLTRIDIVARQNTSTIIAEIFDAVWNRSIVDTGLYKASHLATYNGQFIGSTPEQVRAWFQRPRSYKAGDVFRVVNIVPYASMLEREGRSFDSRRNTKRQNRKLVKTRDRQRRSGDYVRSANGAYFLAAKSAQRKYKYNSKVFFEFVNGNFLNPPGGFPKRDLRGKPLRTHFVKKKRGPYTYPSVKVVVGEGGVL